MLITIIKKEILEAIIGFRFLIALLLCLFLIPLGTYVNLKNYEQRRNDYLDSMQLYQQRAKGQITYDFPAEGYRPPSILSIFTIGLEYFFPNKIITSRNGNFQMISESSINNPDSLLFGKTDLLFNVSIVISLLALIFTFNIISGEKQQGTLSLIMSNPIPRWQILLGKLIGNYIVFLVPFLLSIIIALIVLNISESIPLFSTEIFIAFLSIFFISLLFILSMFLLGILVSTLTFQPITSIVVLLFVWTLLALSIPKISPMLAEVVYPIKSYQVLTLQQELVRRDIEEELDRKRRALYDEIAISMTWSPESGNIEQAEIQKSARKAQRKYDKEKMPLEEEYQQRIVKEMRKLEQDYINKCYIQRAIARNISRISPISCYTYLMTEISKTGVLEMINLKNNAQRFQDEVEKDIYNQYIISQYGGIGGGKTIATRWENGFDPMKVSVPQLQYSFTTLSQALQTELVDIVLLVFFNLVFVITSHMCFLRYDVR